MEKSIVYVSGKDSNKLNCNYAIIEKNDKSVIVINKGLECAIYDYNDLSSSLNYLLLKHYEDESKSYKDFMKLIGKMCKKSSDSKYFNNHIKEDNRIIFLNDFEEHLINDEEKKYYEERLNRFYEFIEKNKKSFKKE